MKSHHVKIAYIVLLISAFIGLVASIESVLAHYSVVDSSFCNISTTFNCDIVNKSEFSTLFGISVGIYGALVYILVIVLAVAHKIYGHRHILEVLTLLMVSSFAFSLYLTYIEAFVLYTWCIVCITSALCVIAMNTSIFALRHHSKYNKSESTNLS